MPSPLKLLKHWLQAFAQVPDLTLWYGPDTYMGRNLAQMFTAMAALSDEAIAQLHPRHTQASIKAMLPRLHCFQEGACIVHHLFGSEVTQLVQKAYGDAFLTAHFEVSHTLIDDLSRLCHPFALSECCMVAIKLQPVHVC